MEINKDTKLTDIIETYPWLADELVKKNKLFKLLDSRMGRIFMKNATIEDLSEKADRTPEHLISELNKMIDEHEGAKA
ncbi:MAG: hypothetical protein Q4A65_05380 [Bacillota bacterium]|nr:hypothetical protein [Bacillota bacterium]